MTYTIWPKTGPFRGVFWMIRFSTCCTKTHFPETQKSWPKAVWKLATWVWFRTPQNIPNVRARYWKKTAARFFHSKFETNPPWLMCHFEALLAKWYTWLVDMNIRHTIEHVLSCDSYYTWLVDMNISHMREHVLSCDSYYTWLVDMNIRHTIQHDSAMTRGHEYESHDTTLSCCIAHYRVVSCDSYRTLWGGYGQ